jgi:prepilin-type N-terminal cleavage/methylation domain-containing protein
MTTSPPSSGSESGRGRRGFTLIELLAVMAIVGLLIGFSMGGLARTTQGSALQGSVRLLRSSLQMARRSAVEQGALARLLLAPGSPATLRLETVRDAVTIAFTESEGGTVLAGRNRRATLRGVKLVEGGTVRSCAEFRGEGTVTLDPGEDLVPRRGFSLALDVWPDPDSPGGELASFGRLFVFRMTAEGALAATLECEGAGSLLEIATADGVIAPGVWSRVELHFDGIEVAVHAHGVVEARKAAGDEQVPIRELVLPESTDRLRLGARGFTGFLDEVIYRTLEETQVVELERGVELLLEHPLELRFDDRGRLDSRIFPGGMTLRLRLEEEVRVVTVDRDGVIR